MHRLAMQLYSSIVVVVWLDVRLTLAIIEMLVIHNSVNQTNASSQQICDVYSTTKRHLPSNGMLSFVPSQCW